ncbi:MAG: hypothetical protein R3235_06835, partial [Altererythrobacter ishigakiensis]|nr:hypothetical protein [Altererythrobacter ishigakiensis]
TRGFAFFELPFEDQINVLQRWSALTEESIKLTKAQITRFKKEVDETAAAATRGTELQLEARLQWIAEMIERVNGS